MCLAGGSRDNSKKRSKGRWGGGRQWGASIKDGFTRHFVKGDRESSSSILVGDSDEGVATKRIMQVKVGLSPDNSP